MSVGISFCLVAIIEGGREGIFLGWWQMARLVARCTTALRGGTGAVKLKYRIAIDQLERGGKACARAGRDEAVEHLGLAAGQKGIDVLGQDLATADGDTDAEFATVFAVA